MRTIGGYRILGLLGRGGMGRVYKVSVPVIDRIAALKLLAPHPHLVDLMGADAIRERFIAEAVLMARLRHPGIVSIWNFDTRDGIPFYVMDYHDNNLGIRIGETYRAEQPTRPLTLDAAIHCGRQTLDALACLHHHGIVHRDIKPFNILLTAYDRVKLCDFGLSRMRGETFGGPSNLKVGSPWYAAPEQAADPDSVDGRADLYSVGVLLYRLITGLLPEGDPPPASARNPDADWRWDRFLERATAPTPAGRFPDAGTMAAELDRLAAAWAEQKEKICRIYPAAPVPVHPVRVRERHRRRCVKVTVRDAPVLFNTDPLWRPLNGAGNDFHPDTADTITDRATRLTWQRGGSPYPLTWREARAYVERLNQSAFAGGRNWRLPTVNELMSLLKATPHGGDLCVKEGFDTRQKRIWSCDRKSFTAAWYVSADLGFVWWADRTAAMHVRAARDRGSIL